MMAREAMCFTALASHFDYKFDAGPCNSTPNQVDSLQGVGRAAYPSLCDGWRHDERLHAPARSQALTFGLARHSQNHHASTLCVRKGWATRPNLLISPAAL
jgi:hypothetical protein